MIYCKSANLSFFIFFSPIYYYFTVRDAKTEVPLDALRVFSTYLKNRDTIRSSIFYYTVIDVIIVIDATVATSKEMSTIQVK